MREVIQQLVAIEAEARQTVLAAQVEADRILADAQHQAQEGIAQGKQETRVAAEQLVLAAIAQANRDKQARLAEIGKEITEQVRLDEKTREQIITAIVRCVTCGP